jgi:hypothetical protein
MRKRHPLLNRFVGDWATVAIINQYLGNQRKKAYDSGTATVPAKYEYLKANASKRDHSSRCKTTSRNSTHSHKRKATASASKTAMPRKRSRHNDASSTEDAELDDGASSSDDETDVDNEDGVDDDNEDEVDDEVDDENEQLNRRGDKGKQPAQDDWSSSSSEEE